MIHVRLVMPELSKMPAPKPGPWQRMAHDVSNALRRIEGFQPAPNALQRFQQRCAKLEAEVKQAAMSVSLLALNRLRELTPSDTGKTASEWEVQSVDEGDSVRFLFTHPNPDLIRWLNYGTKMHVIYAKRAYAKQGAGVLRFEMGGKIVYAKYVFHPGNPAYAFLEKVEAEYMDNLRNLQTMVKL